MASTYNHVSPASAATAAASAAAVAAFAKLVSHSVWHRSAFAPSNAFPKIYPDQQSSDSTSDDVCLAQSGPVAQAPPLAQLHRDGADDQLAEDRVDGWKDGASDSTLAYSEDPRPYPLLTHNASPSIMPLRSTLLVFPYAVLRRCRIIAWTLLVCQLFDVI